MATRIKLGIGSNFNSTLQVSTVAWVNSGFEANNSQILVPTALAKRLGLNAYLDKARIDFYGTPGGPARLYILPSSTLA
jgi:hypothetical protein